MPITTVILSGVLAIVAKAPVQLTLDFAQATEGIAYRIEIKLFNKTGKQVGITQTIDLAAENKVDDILIFFPTAMSNVDLTATLVAGTTKLKITGPAVDFKRIEYSTSTKQGDDWVPNTKIKGPTIVIVGKPGASAPSLVVNPKSF